MLLDKHFYISLFHVILVAPLLIWVGLAREKVPSWMYWVLGAAAIQVFFFHSYKFYSRADFASGWYNLIHILLIAPLLMVIAWNGVETSRRFYEMLLIAGFGALGYHALNLTRQLM
jgi:hypothetical protein